MSDAKGPTEDTPPVARRLAVEAMVIVLSILAAFSIDAWWDDRQEARARQAMLMAIRSDAIAARTELGRVRSGMADGLEGTAKFLALADGSRPEATDASRIDELSTRLFFTPSFDAPLGSLQALLRGGDLSYVDNPELIERTTRLLALVANLEREQLVLASNVTQITEAMNMLEIDVSRLLARLSRDIRQLPVLPRETTLWRHVSDPRVRSLALTSWVRYESCLSSLEQMEIEFLAILALVARQLGED
ncbi:hypothetical protein NOR53_742 [gamma proteobacterium NOR5-3]|nr:hypothetical protein NOR53_742 [gamma proteobacterium NOR5-3]